jgi:hypothetical protein
VVGRGVGVRVGGSIVKVCVGIGLKVSVAIGAEEGIEGITGFDGVEEIAVTVCVSKLETVEF